MAKQIFRIEAFHNYLKTKVTGIFVFSGGNITTCRFNLYYDEHHVGTTLLRSEIPFDIVYDFRKEIRRHGPSTIYIIHNFGFAEVSE
jgi:hypothetical protein